MKKIRSILYLILYLALSRKLLTSVPTPPSSSAGRGRGAPPSTSAGRGRGRGRGSGSGRGKKRSSSPANLPSSSFDISQVCKFSFIFFNFLPLTGFLRGWDYMDNYLLFEYNNMKVKLTENFTYCTKWFSLA